MTNQIIHINNQTYDLADHTPMMVQYLQTKVRYPNAMLLYRMGDFYELFFDDAVLAAELLDITLTRRGKDKSGKEIAMAGVPFHAADSYMARMIAKGQTVVICEQIEEEVDDTAHNLTATNTINSTANTQATKAAKKPAKGIMKREVVRTLTAGTITDEALFAHTQDSSHTPNVVAITTSKLTSKATSKAVQTKNLTLHAAVSSLDLAAGTITCQTLHAESLENLQTELATALARFAPSECLINEDSHHHESTAWLSDWLNQTLNASVSSTSSIMPSTINATVSHRRQTANCPIIEMAGSDFSSVHAQITLCQQFEVQHVEGLGIGDSPLAQATAAALVHYARQTQQRQIPHVNQLIVENTNDYLIVDDICQRNLEIANSVSTGGTSLLTVLNHCKTAMGKRLLPQQIKRPLRNRNTIRLRADAVEQLLFATQDSKSGQLDTLQQTLTAIGDIERISSRISLASAKPRDLSKLADAINSSDMLAVQLTELLNGTAENTADIHTNHKGLLAMLLCQLPTAKPILTEMTDLLNIAIVDEPPAHIRDGGMIKKGYDVELDRLTHLHDNVQETLDNMAQAHRETYNLPSLKVGFNRVSGFYFELPSVQSKSAPDIFTRRQTLKSCERYITEELKDLETEYLNAQSSALAREKLLYNQLLTQLNSHIIDIQQLSKAIAQLDVLINWAHLARIYQWHRPVLTSTIGELVINQGRHVVVEAGMIKRQQQGTHASNHYQSSSFVANDCVMGSVMGATGNTSQNLEKTSDTLNDSAKLLLITGPNMGGKSTYMRQIALIVLLASCGSFVPAQSATIGDIDRIFTRIGSADDLAGGKSTFMVEMIETAHILNLASKKSLVLMDEVGRGTSTTDGLAVAYACVKRLADMNCLTLFATHYFELTTLAEQDTRMKNVHVVASEVDGKLLLLHQIRHGFANSSFGLHVAKMAGVPSAVIDEAKAYLDRSLSQSADHKSVASNNTAQTAQIELFNPSNHSSDRLLSKTLDSLEVTNKEFENDLKSTDAVQNLEKLTQLNELQKLINTAQPDDMTPKQALELLYQLKRSMPL